MKIFPKFRKKIMGKKGGIMPFVLVIISLIVMSTISIITSIQRDAFFVQKIKVKEQARAVAEAGLNDAFGRIKRDGFAGVGDFTGSIDTGSYSVTFNEVSGRDVISSAGTVSGVTVNVSAEVLDKTPTALNYFSGAGNNILFKIHEGVNGTITGDIHANNEVYLYCQPNASLTINGSVSSSGIVQEGNQHYDDDNKDDDLFINGLDDDQAVIYETEDRIIFPELNYAQYKADAEDAGDYYSSGQTFNDAAISPVSGIIYVDGKVTITGTSSLNGGLIADDIVISGTLTQTQKKSCDIIAAKNGDIEIRGRLQAAHCLIYASEDIYTHEKWGPQVVVNGIMLARRDIQMWNFRTYISYNHVYMVPEYMTEETSGFWVVSYND